MIAEFRTFIMRGNVIDLAVGIIIGAAFTAIVNSLVNDVINPLIGLLIGGVDLSNIFIVLRDGVPPGPYQTLEAAIAAGAVTINIGSFLNAVIQFLIIAVVVFFLIRAVNRAMTLGRKKEAAEEAAAPDPMLVAQQELKSSIDHLASVMERKAQG